MDERIDMREGRSPRWEASTCGGRRAGTSVAVRARRSSGERGSCGGRRLRRAGRGRSCSKEPRCDGPHVRWAPRSVELGPETGRAGASERRLCEGCRGSRTGDVERAGSPLTGPCLSRVVPAKHAGRSVLDHAEPRLSVVARAVRKVGEGDRTLDIHLGKGRAVGWKLRGGRGLWLGRVRLARGLARTGVRS